MGCQGYWGYCLDTFLLPLCLVFVGPSGRKAEVLATGIAPKGPGASAGLHLDGWRLNLPGDSISLKS